MTNKKNQRAIGNVTGRNNHCRTGDICRTASQHFSGACRERGTLPFGARPVCAQQRMGRWFLPVATQVRARGYTYTRPHCICWAILTALLRNKPRHSQKAAICRHWSRKNINIKRCLRTIFLMWLNCNSPCGNPICVYDIERTLCDILRGSGSDIQSVGTAMKKYATSKEKDIHKLMQYADQLCVKPKVLRYMEVLLWLQRIPCRSKPLLKRKPRKRTSLPRLSCWNYMLERLLERISLSKYKHNFILKGRKFKL